MRLSCRRWIGFKQAIHWDVMGVYCLFRELVICNVNGDRDGYLVQLSDGLSYHLLSERFPCRPSGRKHILSGIADLSRTGYKDWNIGEKLHCARRPSERKPGGEVNHYHERSEDGTSVNKLEILEENFVSWWKQYLIRTSEMESYCGIR